MFKMLSFGLDAGFVSFSPLVSGLIHNNIYCLFVSKSAQTLTSRSCCHGNRAAGTRPIPNFLSKINPQLNGSALCEKSF